MKAHPRRCGEKSLRRRKMLAVRGSPPQVRGKERRCSMYRTLSRITPAGAGKSNVFSENRNADQNHPRGCGEKQGQLSGRGKQIGSPPRVRGKGFRCISFGITTRITPAGAGKRKTARSASRAARDHPRGCGEKTLRTSVTTNLLGSPPRVRGKEAEYKEHLCKARITPAGAGKRVSSA